MLTWILGAVGITAAGAGLVYLVNWILGNRVSLDEADAAEKAQQARISQMEAAAAQARAQRAKEFDARADGVRTAGDAAQLLHDVTSGTQGP